MIQLLSLPSAPARFFHLAVRTSARGASPVWREARFCSMFRSDDGEQHCTAGPRPRPVDPWAGGMVGPVLFGRGARRTIHARGVVRAASETFVESAQLDIRPGMDGALHHDGDCRLAGLAAWRVRGAAMWRSVCSCCNSCFNAAVVAALFRIAESGARLRGHRAAVARVAGHAAGFLGRGRASPGRC